MKRKLTVKEMVCGGLFVALVTAGAFIHIPVPGMDYFTLQFLFVLTILIQCGKIKLKDNIEKEVLIYEKIYSSNKGMDYVIHCYAYT